MAGTSLLILVPAILFICPVNFVPGQMQKLSEAWRLPGTYSSVQKRRT